MSFSQWWPLALVCLLGAISPGPSLAVVARHSMSGGALGGILCAVTHGMGIFLWAMLMVSGLGTVLVTQPSWFDAIRALGASFLLYLGARTLLQNNQEFQMVSDSSDERTRAGWDGLLIALCNPKIALFFAALFSQFIQPQPTLTEKLVVAVTAASIDAFWYVLVAISLSRLVVTRPFQRYVTLLNTVFGAILIMLSLTVFWSLW
jgi:threonine/homoserine/homoserine lactone efflux protein